MVKSCSNSAINVRSVNNEYKKTVDLLSLQMKSQCRILISHCRAGTLRILAGQICSSQSSRTLSAPRENQRRLICSLLKGFL